MKAAREDGDGRCASRTSAQTLLLTLYRKSAGASVRVVADESDRQSSTLSIMSFFCDQESSEVFLATIYVQQSSLCRDCQPIEERIVCRGAAAALTNI